MSFPKHVSMNSKLEHKCRPLTLMARAPETLINQGSGNLSSWPNFLFTSREALRNKDYESLKLWVS